MKSHHRARVTLTSAAVLALTSVAVGGCGNAAPTRDARSGNLQVPSSQTTTTAPQTADTSKPGQSHLADYSSLLLQAGDLTDDDDTFAAQSSTASPSGVPGASTLFVNSDDTRAISVTVAMYPGAPTATATLREAIATANKTVTGGDPQALPVGTDGTMINGTSPDGGKAVTLVLFTQGPALARLEFNSAIGDVTTDKFVTDVAKMQQIALRVGLPTSS